MKKTTINIQHEANMKAEGKHDNGNCDSTVILETGEVFTSQIDLANRLGVHPSAVSNTICGRQRTCKGYHIVSVSRLAEGMDMVLTRLRETSAVEDDARKWREYQAEQEAIRKAEEERIEAERKAEEKRLEEERKAREKREKEIAKADAKVERCQTIRDRIAAQLVEAERNLMTAQMEREALDDEGEEVA